MPKGSSKMEQDYSAQLEVELPKAAAQAKEGKLAEALAALFQLEKTTRVGGDFSSTVKVARHIVKLCHEAQETQQLKESLVLISKRRGQEKRVVQSAVQEAMGYLDELADRSLDEMLSVLETLREICEGKIFVELERATLTRRLAGIREKQGDVGEAARVLQEVQVETLAKMRKQEKVEFILEQVRLCLAANDHVRAQILARKINPKVLQGPDMDFCKVTYYSLSNQFHAHNNDHLAAARSYMHMYQTPSIQNERSDRDRYLRLLIVSACLAPYSNEQDDLMHRIELEKPLRDLPAYKQLLKSFLTLELMRWPVIKQTYEKELNALEIFVEPERNAKLWEVLHLRVIEHNIRVVSAYYSRISSKRLSQLLDLPYEQVEARLSDLVTQGLVFARIDRPAGVVSFQKPRDPNEVLNDWSGDVKELLDKIERTSHLINRETMFAQSKSKSRR